MLNKTHVIAVLAVVSVLLGSLFVDNVILAQTGGGEYDPWIDLNDDGDIDADDLYLLANEYGTSGESINKTALLLDLLDRVEALENQMDFDAFRYFKYDSSFDLADWPDGSGSYSVPGFTNVAFRMRLTNYDPSGNERTLTLSSHSLVWMYFPTVGKQTYWHVVNVDASGTVQMTYSDISIGYKETVYVYFASSRDGEFGPNQQKPGSTGPAAVNLLLLGTIGSSLYGQNIPFVSVYSS